MFYPYTPQILYWALKFVRGTNSFIRILFKMCKFNKRDCYKSVIIYNKWFTDKLTGVNVNDKIYADILLITRKIR